MHKNVHGRKLSQLSRRLPKYSSNDSQGVYGAGARLPKQPANSACQFGRIDRDYWLWTPHSACRPNAKRPDNKRNAITSSLSEPQPIPPDRSRAPTGARKSRELRSTLAHSSMHKFFVGLLLSLTIFGARPACKNSEVVPPPSAQREMACRVAAANLVNLARARGPLEQLSDNQLRDIQPDIDFYDETCLSRRDELRFCTRRAIDMTVGFFFFRRAGKSDVICAGFRIDTHHVVTAAHCLWIGSNRLDPRSLKFSLIGAPRLEFTPNRIFRAPDISGSTELTDSGDIAVIEIDTESVPMLQGLVKYSTSLASNEHLMVPGVNLLVYRLVVHRDTRFWERALRVDKSDSCVRDPTRGTVAPSQTSCIYDRCQTLEAMSGAPIFVIKDKQIYIAGIHLRSGQHAELGRECGSKPGFNVGVTLPKWVSRPEVE